MNKAVAVLTYDYWTLPTYKSTCYCINLHCMHSIIVIYCEPNNQLLILHAE